MQALSHNSRELITLIKEEKDENMNQNERLLACYGDCGVEISEMLNGHYLHDGR